MVGEPPVEVRFPTSVAATAVTFEAPALLSTAGKAASVLKLVLAAAHAVPAVRSDPPPKAFPCAYKDFGIGYELRIWIDAYQNRAPISGEVNRHIWYQFKRRGIEIPFPMSDKLLCDFMHVVNTQQHLPAPPEEAARRVRELQRSDFIARLFVDAAGHPLLTDGDLTQLAPLLRFVRYTAGETIFRQGDAGESCYVIVRGHLHGRVEFQDATPPTEFDPFVTTTPLNETAFGKVSPTVISLK